MLNERKMKAVDSHWNEDCKIKHVTLVGVDTYQRRVYVDELGKLWKYTEPGEMPQERHDKLFQAANNELEGEPACPLHPDIDYQILYGEDGENV